MNLIALIAAASFKLRILRNWADEQDILRPDLVGHPILVEIHQPTGFDYVYAGPEASTPTPFSVADPFDENPSIRSGVLRGRQIFRN